MRRLLGFWLFMVSAGVVLLFLPEPPKRPLVPTTGWEFSGGVSAGRPPIEFVSPGLVTGDDRVTWRTVGPGSIQSPAFKPPRFVALPVVGYPMGSALSLDLECVSTGKKLGLDTAHYHDSWVERTLWIPESFCPSEIRVTGRSAAPTHFVGFGTPVEASLLSWLKESVFVIAAIHAICALLLVLPGLAVARLLGRDPSEPGTWAFWVLPASLLAGYASFYLSYYLPTAGKALGLVAVLASAIVLWRRGTDAAVPRDSPRVPTPVAGWLLLSLFVFLGVYATDNEAGPWTANYRYSPAVWSTDDQLSRIVAEKLYEEESILGIFGHWKTSDRPPLLSGAYTLLRPWWEAVLGIGDNVRLGVRFYQATGTILMTAWILPAWLLLARAGFTRRETVLTLALCATTGFTFFNMSYTWPKLLAGWLGLGAFILVRDSSVHAGVLAALALLSHGGVLFGLLPMGVLLLQPPRPRPAAVALAGLAAGALLLPWMLWQRFEDPPGNALVKFAFAGTWGFGEDEKGVWTTVKEAYAPLTWSSWLRTRGEALALQFGRFHDPLMPGFPRSNSLGRMRLGDFLYPGSTLRWLHLGWPLWLLALWRRGSLPPGDRQAASWVSFGLAGVVLNLLLTFRLQLVHTQSFVSMLLLILGLAALIVRAPRPLRNVAIGLHVSYFVLVWMAAPLLDGPRLRFDVLLGWVLAAGALAALVRLPAPAVDEDQAPVRAGAATTNV